MQSIGRAAKLLRNTVLVAVVLGGIFYGVFLISSHNYESGEAAKSAGPAVAAPSSASPVSDDADGCMAATGAAIDAANARGDYSAAGAEASMPQRCIDAGY